MKEIAIVMFVLAVIMIIKECVKVLVPISFMQMMVRNFV